MNGWALRFTKSGLNMLWTTEAPAKRLPNPTEKTMALWSNPLSDIENFILKLQQRQINVSFVRDMKRMNLHSRAHKPAVRLSNSLMTWCGARRLDAVPWGHGTGPRRLGVGPSGLSVGLPGPCLRTLGPWCRTLRTRCRTMMTWCSSRTPRTRCRTLGPARQWPGESEAGLKARGFVASLN